MIWGFFGRGVVIGFAVAAPVGAIGVLCIRRTLAGGRAAGLATGLGAAIADSLYGAVAAFGLTAVSGSLMAQQVWLRLGGGLFLLVLGARAFFAPVGERPRDERTLGVVGDFASTLALTLTNPSTILSFGAVFAGLGLFGRPGGYDSAVALVTGVFLGSATWWVILTSVSSLLRARFEHHGMIWVNRASGVVIAGFGLVALAGLVR